jgi:purine-binding chemotaxis protein CheW
MNATLSDKSTIAALAGKYLTFCLGDESYGVSVLKIREIIRQTNTTAIPQVPPYVKGVINLRGKIIPVIDLCIKFDLEHAASSDNACIVVVQVNGPENRPIQLGLAVDAVEEVCQLAAAELEETPEFGAAVDTSCILGMAKVKGAVKTLLDIDRVLGASTLATIEAAPAGA